MHAGLACAPLGACAAPVRALPKQSRVTSHHSLGVLVLLLLSHPTHVTRHEPYNLKVDVYSFAMIIFQLFETTTPFHGHDPVDAARQAAMLGARPGFPPRRNLTPMTQVSAAAATTAAWARAQQPTA